LYGDGVAHAEKPGAPTASDLFYANFVVVSHSFDDILFSFHDTYMTLMGMGMGMGAVLIWLS
jgi:hypothetical protein